MMSAPVRLGPSAHPESQALVADATTVVGAGPAQWLSLAQQWGPRLPLPGHGQTLLRWELLASVGAVDLSIARTLEPHADALAILAEAGLPTPDGPRPGQPGVSPDDAERTWGVYAAEGPPPRLEASRRDAVAGPWLLTGTKPWCSLAGHVTDALVTAWLDGEQTRGLFAVSLRAAEVHPEPVAWVSRGLTDIVSAPVTFDGATAHLVGSPGWYLGRDGFAWGGIGVAAVWFGAAVALARRLRSPAVRRPPDQLHLAHLGAVDVALTGARCALAEAAAAVDGGHAGGPAGELLALRVRGVVADAVDRVLRHVDRALGPGPLTQEEEHARRVADLQIYRRQHHAERDDATLGARLLPVTDDRSSDPW
ncbi:acyl-CoA dehydrogenase [Dermatophilaceae bacterium Soc4.6]